MRLIKKAEKKNTLGGFKTKFNQSMMFNATLGLSFGATIIEAILNNVSKSIAINNNQDTRLVYDTPTPHLRLSQQAKNSALSFW